MLLDTQKRVIGCYINHAGNAAAPCPPRGLTECSYEFIGTSPESPLRRIQSFPIVSDAMINIVTHDWAGNETNTLFGNWLQHGYGIISRKCTVLVFYGHLGRIGHLSRTRKSTTVSRINLMGWYQGAQPEQSSSGPNVPRRGLCHMRVSTQEKNDIPRNHLVVDS